MSEQIGLKELKLLIKERALEDRYEGFEKTFWYNVLTINPRKKQFERWVISNVLDINFPRTGLGPKKIKEYSWTNMSSAKGQICAIRIFFKDSTCLSFTCIFDPNRPSTLNLPFVFPDVRLFSRWTCSCNFINMKISQRHFFRLLASFTRMQEVTFRGCIFEEITKIHKFPPKRCEFELRLLSCKNFAGSAISLGGEVFCSILDLLSHKDIMPRISLLKIYPVSASTGSVLASFEISSRTFTCSQEGEGCQDIH
ncbi:unnamed protein product [Moneuplotes crassus]|uniref:Uncharacterized protein n=1 Tax=Euplotes crassus TaxID=5936 RepID=A0AAD1XVQ2_EUPCR|nr:unnamed protein product [Moneuplotes crassus]